MYYNVNPLLNSLTREDIFYGVTDTYIHINLVLYLNVNIIIYVERLPN